MCPANRGKPSKEDWNIESIQHQGGHTSEYYAYVRKLLNRVMEAHSGKEWGAEELRAALKAVKDKVREAVLSGEIKLYN